VTQRELVGRTATVIGLILLTWFLYWIFSQIAEVLVLLLISAVFAAGLAPLVGALTRCKSRGGRRLSPGAAILVVYLAIFVAAAGILSIVVVPAVNETIRFVAQLPVFVAKVQVLLIDLHARFPWLPDFTQDLDQLRQSLRNPPAWLAPKAASVAFRFAGDVGAVVTVLVFTFYMLLQGADIKRGFLLLFPPAQRPRVALVLDRVSAKFGGWLRAQLLLSLSVALPVAAALAALRMPYPLLLAVVAGIGELIPMVGPALGGAVAVLVALTQQPWQLIGVAVFYLILMNVEPHILVPRIMSSVVGLSPIFTLVALLTGIKLLGILGGLLAVPVAAAIQVIVAEVVREIQPTPITPVAADLPGPQAGGAEADSPGAARTTAGGRGVGTP
jgi:predicted PurR-regulated permease PerM